MRTKSMSRSYREVDSIVPKESRIEDMFTTAPKESKLALYL